MIFVCFLWDACEHHILTVAVSVGVAFLSIHTFAFLFGFLFLLEFFHQLHHLVDLFLAKSAFLFIAILVSIVVKTSFLLGGLPFLSQQSLGL